MKEVERYRDVVELLHYHEKSGKYRKLVVSVAEDGVVVVSLSEGKKGEPAVRVNFSLNRQELIYLAKELEMLYQELRNQEGRR